MEAILPLSSSSSPILKKMSPILKCNDLERNGIIFNSQEGSDPNRRACKPNSSSPKQNSPSFVGIATSRRFSKKLTNRVFGNRTRSVLSSRMSSCTKEPSFRMEPKLKFCPAKVCEIANTILEEKLQDVNYSSEMCGDLTTVLCEEIKEQVKALHFDRYKIVCIVNIGEKNNHDITMCSRCIWDEKLDNYANCSYQSVSLYCNVTVYGIYNE